MKTIPLENCERALSIQARDAFKNFMDGKTVVLGENGEKLVHMSDWQAFMDMPNWADYCTE